MGRAIGGAVVGYIVMVAIVFCGLTLAWMLLGADGAFEVGVFDVSMTWIVVSIVVAIIAALAGGRVARAIARSRLGPQILAGIVIVLGVATLIPTLLTDVAVVVRSGDMPMFDAIAQARTPLWMMILNPIIGALGALIGGNALAADVPAAAP